MTSAGAPSKPPPHHPMSPTQPVALPSSSTQPVTPASPPSRRADLKSWWKKFQVQGRHHDAPETRPQGIFGVPLRQSITYANVAISLVDEDGQSYIYGYVPIVVAKCGVYLKEKATNVEGIFRLNGSEKRIKELKIQFDSPDRYGKGLVWDGYTVHDAANVLRRYLNDLPEPVVPLDLYAHFREPLRGYTKQAVGDMEGSQFADSFNENEAIDRYQQLIKDLPPLNRQLLLYILDLLAVFAAKADENRMTAQNLAAIFQPGMLSHPQHAMAPEEYRLNQCVIIFLIEHQDNFLIGMQGTGTDEQTKQEIEQGTPKIVTPTTPNRKTGVVRSGSNASAGAESVSRDGKVRRNRSTSSRQSRYSNGATTPNSPAITTPGGSGLGRSNTLPSKKSPHLPAGRFARQQSPAISVAPASPSPALTPTVDTPATVTEEISVASDKSTTTSSVMPAATAAGRSQERLLAPPGDTLTPSKDRNLQSLFHRSPTSDSEKRQPNKLRKKRLPSSTNPSAHSSTASLTQSAFTSPNAELPDPIEDAPNAAGNIQPENGLATETPSEHTPRASLIPSAGTLANDGHDTLRPQPSQTTSLHSSFNDGSEAEQLDDSGLPLAGEHAEKEKKRRWRMSRRREDATSPNRGLGINSHAEMSNSTVGSSHRPRKSFTGESSETAAAALSESDTGAETRGPLGWIKTKYREARGDADHKRTKSPTEGHGLLPSRSKSVDINRTTDEKRPAVGPSPIKEADEPDLPSNVQEGAAPTSPVSTAGPQNEGLSSQPQSVGNKESSP